MSDHAHADGHDRNKFLQARVNRLIEVAEERGITTAGDIDQWIEQMTSTAEANNGGRIVARAWVDPDFAARLIVDAGAAIAELDFELGNASNVNLMAVPNTEQVHNVVVCTLCSCYPMALLGPPPSWYKSEAYRSRVVRNPREVLSEFGLELSDQVSVRVWDATSDLRYLVIPMRPEGTEGMSERELAVLVTRNSLIGTGVVKAVAAS